MALDLMVRLSFVQLVVFLTRHTWHRKSTHPSQIQKASDRLLLLVARSCGLRWVSSPRKINSRLYAHDLLRGDSLVICLWNIAGVDYRFRFLYR